MAVVAISLQSRMVVTVPISETFILNKGHKTHHLTKPLWLTNTMVPWLLVQCTSFHPYYATSNDIYVQGDYNTYMMHHNLNHHSLQLFPTCSKTNLKP